LLPLKMPLDHTQGPFSGKWKPKCEEAIYLAK